MLSTATGESIPQLPQFNMEAIGVIPPNSLWFLRLGTTISSLGSNYALCFVETRAEAKKFLKATN